MMNSNFHMQNTENVHIREYIRFYQRCQKSSTLALPIFSLAEN